MLLDNGGINAYLRLPKATREAKEMALAFDIAEVIQGRKGIDEATLAVMATL